VLIATLVCECTQVFRLEFFLCFVSTPLTAFMLDQLTKGTCFFYICDLVMKGRTSPSRAIVFYSRCGRTDRHTDGVAIK